MSDQSNQPIAPATSNLPEAVGGQTGFDPNFIGEFATMNLDPIKGHTYMVSIRTGDPTKGQFLLSACHGPYDFLEMVQEVGLMYQEHQHHAQVIILTKERDKRVQFLDQNTVDFIEANWESLIAEGVFEDALAQNPEYTHTAGVANVSADIDPRQVEKKETQDEEP